MTEPLRPCDETSVPRFARGFRLRHDAVRDQWTVLGPERAFVPDPIAAEILRLVDGHATLGTIVDDLAGRFAAPRDQIAADVLALVTDLSARGALRT